MKWMIQGSGALAWGIFFSVAPVVEVLYMGAILWIPLLAWREHARAKKYGFWPGFLVRFTVFATIITVALLLPVKQQDTLRMGPFSRVEISLSDVSEHFVGRAEFPVARGHSVVRLPSLQPTFREVVSAVERDTGLHARVGYCGTGATLLGGSYPMYVVFEAQTRSP